MIAASAQAERLKIATSADYPPWESVDTAGKIIGFDVEVGNQICARIGAECEWVNQAFSGLVPALVAGQFDLIISGLSITDKRKKKINFSIAYAQIPWSFGGLKGRFAPDLEGDRLKAAVKGKAIGVQTSSIGENVLNKHFAVEGRGYEKLDPVIADLHTRRIDAATMDFSAWSEFIKQPGNENLTRFGPSFNFADFAELGQGTGVGISKQARALKARVDRALDQMLADGTIKLSIKWFGYDVSP